MRKHFRNGAKSVFADRIRHGIASNKFGSRDYWRFCKSVLKKDYILNSPSSISFQRYHLLLTKQNALLGISLPNLLSNHQEGFYGFLMLKQNMQITVSMISVISKLDPHREWGIIAVVLRPRSASSGHRATSGSRRIFVRSANPTPWVLSIYVVDQLVEKHQLE